MSDTKEVMIFTHGDRNIRRDLKGETPFDFVVNVRKAGGLWDCGEFFPWHSLLHFQFE